MACPCLTSSAVECSAKKPSAGHGPFYPNASATTATVARIDSTAPAPLLILATTFLAADWLASACDRPDRPSVSVAMRDLFDKPNPHRVNLVRCRHHRVANHRLRGRTDNRTKSHLKPATRRSIKHFPSRKAGEEPLPQDQSLSTANRHPTYIRPKRRQQTSKTVLTLSRHWHRILATAHAPGGEQ